jgi:outer membrane protein assembly factor BamB
VRFSALLLLLAALPAAAADDWPQFGHDARHAGKVDQFAQPLLRIFADVEYDPFVADEQDSTGGDLLVHYQVPLVDGDDVFMEFKSGRFTGEFTWQTQEWSIHRLHWENGTLADKWSAPTDWKPAPAASVTSWEPEFHAILANGFLYEPGAGGTLLQIDRGDGSLVRRINPFGATVDTSTYVTGPPAADATGNIYYTAIRFNPSAPWTSDVRGAWLVRVAPDATTSLVSFSTIAVGAPPATAQCLAIFDLSQTPLPPSPNAVPPSITCGSQRPGLNVAPAIAPDGTIYVVSRAHFNSYWGMLVAVNPDLTPKWATSMRGRFHDGCNVSLPPNGTDGGCRTGTATGVNPEENLPGAGRVVDMSTSSPVVAPDGSILYGAFSLYNDGQGHLMHFASDGTYLGAYPFGWDITPAIWQHDGTWSAVIKENHYGGAVHPTPAYFITQLAPSLDVEWQARNTTTVACGRHPDGSVSCVPAQPEGFEWCVNAPAIDANGTVYVNSEDGFLYAIAQGGAIRQKIFLQLAIGAAYTPVSIGLDGRIYAQNAGHLFAIGGQVHPRAVRH